MLEDLWLKEGDFLDGRYRIKKLIKAGGMGAVYQAEDTALDLKLCAVKQMLDKFTNPADRRQAVEQFISEIEVLGHISHPAIPKVTDHFLHKNSFYFVMDYLEGVDLSSFLSQHQRQGFPANQVLEWALQVLEALEYLQSFNPPIVHRDIKPSNLFQRKSDGRILLIDFGIARVFNPAEGYWIGTAGYAPPEQQMGKPEPRSDLYALGATIHELISGRKPDSFYFPSFKELGKEVDPKLDEVLAKALQWNPEDRFASAAEMKEKVKAVLGYNPEFFTSKTEEAFHRAISEVRTRVLEPALKEVMQRYQNECITKFVPKHIDYFVFTLGSPVAFEFIIKKNDEARKLEFYEKQGILEKIKLGEINPLLEEEIARINDLVHKFTCDYEDFKNANWQIS